MAPPLNAADPELHERLRRVEGLVQGLETCPDPAAREATRELVRALLDLHAAGLARMLDLAARPAVAGESAADRFAHDGLVGSLLLLYGLHPIPVADRVARALAELRLPAGRAEVVEATGDRVRVRLRGDAAAGAALRRAVETAVVEAAPDVSAVVIEEDWDPSPDGRVALPLVSAGRAV
jgi:hypothetical protein